MEKDVGKTDEKLDKLEAELLDRKREADRYRSVIEHQTELICRYLRDGTLTFVNDAYCRFFGMKREELIGFNFKNLIPEQDRGRIEDMVNGMSGGMPYCVREHRILMRDGKIGWQVWTNRPIFDDRGDILEYQGVGHDITAIKEEEQALQESVDYYEKQVEETSTELLARTREMKVEIEERKRFEDALKASEQKYRSVVDNVGIGIVLVSPQMEILTLNNQMKAWFPQLDPEKKPICYVSFNDPPRQDICPYCPTFQTLRDGEVHESVTETPSAHDIRNYRIISSPIKDASGNVVAAIEMVDDITVRVLAERALKESEARYRTIFETTGAATMIIGEDMTIFMVNTEFEEQSGYKKAEVERKMKWTEFIADDEGMLERMIEYHRLRRVDEVAAPRNYEFRFRDKSGQVRDVYMTIAMIPGTMMSVASLLDITERKKAEKELLVREEELKVKSRNLEELNTALKVLLKHREDDREELEERILSNVQELVIPYLEKLKRTPLKSDQLAYMGIIESNLDDILSPFLRKMTSKYLNLTPREIQIATLIREGRTTKEISEVLNISSRAVEFHRDNIRVKLGLKNKKANLRSFLLSLT
ncbi:MAG TPA: PAS domain S-box protein [Syntrophales bacterium]|nr:PAS domain S-box protein [Syntrophales bacterium]HOX94343.1 PAS domain S-box protein [Syntrophales bacterium]HPI57088.1 PAS domain S-box protein [Syntrophales bacterium]HPN24825.1 PAS domain S-box protein [Syntrophales bacterium]HQM30112.1 PAS domain S-box protein [Syntrophales bacterium]